jgi:hypothetical protein
MPINRRQQIPCQSNATLCRSFADDGLRLYYPAAINSNIDIEGWLTPMKQVDHQINNLPDQSTGVRGIERN